MRGVKLGRISVLFVVLLFPAGCSTPQAVGDFCDQSQKALSAAVPVFEDLGASCLRVKTLAKGIGSFEVVESDPGCEAIGQEAGASVAAVKLLAEYFGALHALAAFGTAQTAADAEALAAKAAGAGGADTGTQAAVGSMAQFLTEAGTGASQKRALHTDIHQVSTNIAAVTGALIQILQENYLHQELGDEQEKLATHYKEFAVAHPEAPVVVLLDERWQTDQARLRQRRAAAQAAVRALTSIQEGVAALASQPGSPKPKQIAALLEPYIAQLEAIIPQMQKAL